MNHGTTHLLVSITDDAEWATGENASLAVLPLTATTVAEYLSLMDLAHQAHTAAGRIDARLIDQRFYNSELYVVGADEDELNEKPDLSPYEEAVLEVLGGGSPNAISEIPAHLPRMSTDISVLHVGPDTLQWRLTRKHTNYVVTTRMIRRAELLEVQRQLAPTDTPAPCNPDRATITHDAPGSAGQSARIRGTRR